MESAFAGGSEEAQDAYDEAMNAIFSLQLECFRHAQPHRSKKDGSTKWAMIEMWPMQVSAMALCKRVVLSSITHHWNLCRNLLCRDENGATLCKG